jgi:hypothetical protein
MGLFDTFVTPEALRCPICNVPLTNWQGKDGPGALFVWKQGVPSPIDQDAGRASISAGARAMLRLPDTFEIYSGDCGRHVVDAVGRCEAGVWASTEVVAANPVRATIVSLRS